MALRHFSAVLAEWSPPEEVILRLFPVRFQGIKAVSCGDNGKPKWFTRKYIGDQDLLDFGKPDYFLGCGFGSVTHYALLDIDRGSQYHPRNDRRAFNRLLETLEGNGFVKVIIVQSSWSEGIHIYLVLPSPVKTFALACTLHDVVSAAGFTVAKGVLEIFPNKKSKDAIYNRHRYPCQQGSFVLDGDLNPISDRLVDFERHWNDCRDQNDMTAIKGALSQSYLSGRKFKAAARSAKGKNVAEWKERLEKAIANGWTGDAETNDLLGDIAVYGVTFKGLTDVSELAEYIHQTAEEAPGYWSHCDHRPGGSEPKKTDKRAIEWARSALRHYAPLGKKKGEFKPIEVSEKTKGLTPSERRLEALQRQLSAIGEAIANGITFTTITECRRWLSRTAGSSLATIAKNWDKLWGKLKDLIKAPEPAPQKKPNPSPMFKLEILKIMCIFAQGKGSSDFEEGKPETEIMCISVSGKDLSESMAHAYKTKLSYDYLPEKAELDPFSLSPFSESDLRPRNIFDFERFTKKALEHNPDFQLPELSWFDVPAMAGQAFSEMLRSGYFDDYEAIQNAVGELNRVKPLVVFVVLDWLKTLPSVPKGDRPKPASIVSQDELHAAKKAKRAKGYRKYLAAVGGGRNA